MTVNTIEEAIEDIRAGKMVILVDDEDRENEGDLCMAAFGWGSWCFVVLEWLVRSIWRCVL